MISSVDGIQVLENISGDSYAIALTQGADVQIADEFLPFLYPNQYVNFTADSKVVAKGSCLARDAHSDLDVVDNIFRQNNAKDGISVETFEEQNCLALRESFGFFIQNRPIPLQIMAMVFMRLPHGRKFI